MNIAEAAMAAAITASIAGVSYVAFNPTAVTHTAQSTADRASCRTVNDAIVAYVAMNETAPKSITQLKPYVLGDISAYRIERGLAAGPGC